MLVVGGTSAAFATSDLSDIAQNIQQSITNVPGLISALAYSLGLLFGVMAMLKFKEHVESPQQVPLREPVIRLLAGGALFALPIVYESMRNAFSGGGGLAAFDHDTFVNGILGLALGGLGAVFGGNVNQILNSILLSIQDVPGLISAGAYLLGVVLGVTGILKIKEHVESPQQVQMKEGVIRLLVGGALMALPIIYEAVAISIDQGGINLTNIISGGFIALGFVFVGQTLQPVQHAEHLALYQALV
jgi:ABC-type spermidine/putrescine transport system permease subunit II